MADAFPSLTAGTSSTTGAAAFVLDTADRTDYLRTPKRAVTDGDLTNGDNVYYCAVDKSVVDGDAIFEVGYGAYDDTANTIARTAGNVISGSNGPGTLVSMPGSGERDINILDQVPYTSSQVSLSNAFRIASDGDIGFGTASPTQSVDISRDITTLRIKSNDADSNAWLRIENDAQAFLAGVLGSNDSFNLRDLTAGSVYPFRVETSVPTLALVMKNSEVVVNDGGVDLDFRVEGTGAVNALFVQGSDGYVGIGTSAPSGNIHVSNGAFGGTIPGGEHELLLEDDSGVRLTMLSPDAAAAVIQMGSPSDTNGTSIQWQHSTKIFSIIAAAGGSETIELRAGSQTNAVMKSNGSLNFPPQATPSSPAKGDAYLDSTSNKLRVYDGTSWNDCW